LGNQFQLLAREFKQVLRRLPISRLDSTLNVHGYGRRRVLDAKKFDTPFAAGQGAEVGLAHLFRPAARHARAAGG
jgi:hypothetical protein